MNDLILALLYILGAIVALLIAVAPLGCWMALGRIEKLLKDRLPEKLDYYGAKQTQALTDIRDDGIPVDVRSIKKSSPV